MSSKGSSNSGQVPQQNIQTPQYQPSVAGSIPIKVWLYIIGVPLLIGGAYYGVYKPLKKRLGGKEKGEEEALDRVNDISGRQTWWSRSYYTTVNNGRKPLTEGNAKFYADQLYEAMKGGKDWYDLGWGTDEEQIYGAIRNIGSKAGISQVSEKYWNSYQSDLLGDLQDELTQSELGQVNQIITTFV